jgi:hypothetical protein
MTSCSPRTGKTQVTRQSAINIYIENNLHKLPQKFLISSDQKDTFKYYSEAAEKEFPKGYKFYTHCRKPINQIIVLNGYVYITKEKDKNYIGRD